MCCDEYKRLAEEMTLAGDLGSLGITSDYYYHTVKHF